MRRQARRHTTVASQQHEAVVSEDYWDFRPNERVMTIDGPGRVTAVHDGPFPGSEQYEIALEGGLGGGTYAPGQVTAVLPTQASVGHTADMDYPELGTLLHDRPDPATMRYTASMDGGGGDGGDGGDSSHPPRSSAEVASGQADEGYVPWNPGEYNDTLYHDRSLASLKTAETLPDDHPDKVYLRFGQWPEDERSRNNVTGHKEDGVSVYDLDHHGNPMDPDPDFSRGHHHDEDCEPDCDMHLGNEDYGNDTREEMNGRAMRAEKAHRYGQPVTHSDVGHLVKGTMVGIGHDGEPLIQNVKRVGDWIDHRHHFIPTAEPHPQARSEDDEGYEHPVGKPEQLKLFGSQGDPDLPDEDRDWHAGDPEEWLATGYCHVGHPGPCRYKDRQGDPETAPESSLPSHRTAMPSRKYPEHPEGFESEVASNGPHQLRLNGYAKGRHVGYIEHTPYDERGHPLHAHDDPTEATHLKVHMLSGGGVPGAASALMDHLYEKYPKAMINHGYRSSEGLAWWNSYEEPDPGRNVHNVHPREWDHLFDREDVAEDVRQNEENDPGHHTDEHDVDWAYENEAPHPADDMLHRGISVHMSPTDHEYVHDETIPREHRAQHLLNLVGRGDMPEHDWHVDEDSAHRQAENESSTPNASRVVGDTFHNHAKTNVVMHGEFDEHAARDHEYDRSNGSFDMVSDEKPRDFHLVGLSWGKRGGDINGHYFHERQPVAIPPDNQDIHHPMSSGHGEAAAVQREHEERTRPREIHSEIPGQQELFKAARSINGEHIDDHGTAPDEVRADHPNSYDRRSTEGEPDPAWIKDIDKRQQAMASSLPSVVGSEVWRGPHDNTTEELREHLIRHHGEDPSYFGGSLDDRHYDLHNGDEDAWDFEEPDHQHHDISREHHPAPWEGKDRSGGSTQNENRRDTALFGTEPFTPRPYSLSMLTTSSLPQPLAHLTLGPAADDHHGLARHLMDHHGYSLDQIQDSPDPGQNDALFMQHELEHNGGADEGVSGEFGRGEKESIAHDHKGTAVHNRFPLSTQWNHHGPPQGHYLSMLKTAAENPSFRFHVLAAWTDVRAKATRIRRSGGVQITHASEGYVIANVRGDHDVYETGLQRVPGRRQSVAVYSCGCKWGAYHWGADDDMSRFAGRMCSHALALQYEAQSRGMFGRDVTIDDAKPRWVPSKVVVKYDIDEGRNIQARSSLPGIPEPERFVPEQAPMHAFLALAEEGDPGLRAVTSAVNDLFGDSTGYVEPPLMQPMGPTIPWNKDENPTSAGPLKAPEADNWGRINSPTMLPRLASAITTEAFWQLLAPIVRAVAPKVLEKAAPAAAAWGTGKVVDKVTDKLLGKEEPSEGAEAALHDEPEGALPTTDGEEHTASLGDLDIVDDHSLWSLGDDALSPENPSIQTQGSVSEIVAEFQRSAAATQLMSPARGLEKDGLDIAAAAEQYLAKTAASSFTLAERQALIEESPGVQAGNTDRLDIKGTHYAEIQRQEDEGEGDDLWLM